MKMTTLRRIHIELPNCEEPIWFTPCELESVQRLAAGIAHNFNNLLGAILASTELGLEYPARSPVEVLRQISALVARGAETVRQLELYTETEPAFEQVDVSALVEDMLPLIRTLISPHLILKTSLTTDSLIIWGNDARIRQMISNLVTNASEAIREKDGTIRVTTAHLKLRHDSSQTGADVTSVDEWLMLEISDTGRGISPDLQGKIFDPFFTTKSDGRGLGLSVVQGIVRQHRGTIAVWSAPNRGTRFRVMLPLSDVTALKTEKVATPTAQLTRPTKHEPNLHSIPASYRVSPAGRH